MASHRFLRFFYTHVIIFSRHLLLSNGEYFLNDDDSFLWLLSNAETDKLTVDSTPNYENLQSNNFQLDRLNAAETKPCSELEIPSHGVVECKPTFCKFSCDANYKLVGDHILACDKGKWKGTEPRCVAETKTCSELEIPSHGVVECIPTYCEFSCDHNYQLVGDHILACDEGKWKGTKPRCVDKTDTVASRDCATIKKDNPGAKSGRYTITLGISNKKIEVFCDMKTEGGGWTVFQRRTSKGEKHNFERNWTDYKNGFGDLDDEFWLGNDAIYELTESREQVLRIDLEDYNSEKRYAEYLNFHVANEDDDYRLQVAQYRGTARDSFTQLQHNSRFSTRGHAEIGSEKCVEEFKGGWWYGTYSLCHYSNLNGLNHKGPHMSYADGINWFYFGGFYKSLKETEMKMRPINLTALLWF